MVLPLAIIGGGMALGALGNYLSRRSQGKAQQRASELQARLAREQMANAQSAGERGYQGITEAGLSAGQTLQDYANRSRRDLMTGNQGAMAAYGSGIDAARGTINTGYDDAASSLGQGYYAASSRLSPLAALSRYGEMAVASPIGANFEADPGYQFRLGQGQQAVDRAAAAAGGRLSGAALKKLTEYNQGFASNEFGNAANRDIALRNMQMQLGQTGYGAISRLSDLDVSRGTGLAGLQTQRSALLSGLDTSQGQYNANILANQGQNLANMQQGLGSQLANLGTSTAASQSNALLGGAGMQSNIAQSMLMPTYSQGVPYAGAGYQALGNLAGQATNLAAFGYGSGMFGRGSSGVDPYYLAGGTDFGY